MIAPTAAPAARPALLLPNALRVNLLHSISIIVVDTVWAEGKHSRHRALCNRGVAADGRSRGYCRGHGYARRSGHGGSECGDASGSADACGVGRRQHGRRRRG